MYSLPLQWKTVTRFEKWWWNSDGANEALQSLNLLSTKVCDLSWWSARKERLLLSAFYRLLILASQWSVLKNTFVWNTFCSEIFFSLIDFVFEVSISKILLQIIFASKMLKQSAIWGLLRNSIKCFICFSSWNYPTYDPIYVCWLILVFDWQTFFRDRMAPPHLYRVALVPGHTLILSCEILTKAGKGAMTASKQ